MDGLFFLSTGFLCALFCIIGGFVVKLWLDERNAVRRRDALAAMGVEQQATPRNEAQRRSPIIEEVEPQSGSNDEENYDGEVPDFPTNDPKIGKKKLAKLQAKAEAKARREEEQTERLERKRQQEIKEKQDEAERLLKEEEEQKRKEQLRAEKEERERKEMEEYKKLKESFNVEEQGFDVMDEESSENLIKSFIEYIQQKKVVHVDELASHFGLSSEEVVNRLETFIDEKLITGVFDDRGKFVYVTDDELQAVAKFINQRGRVTLQELVEYSNHLISLDSSTTAAECH
ncbi:DDRGK domain-containing protein [Ditylenchus destructor]|nr:DDRGK domain-containing protein [Ditylenchus destructor]